MEVDVRIQQLEFGLGFRVYGLGPGFGIAVFGVQNCLLAVWLHRRTLAERFCQGLPKCKNLPNS